MRVGLRLGPLRVGAVSDTAVATVSVAVVGSVCVFKLVFILVFSIHFFQSLVFLYVRNFQLAKFCERD